MLSWKCKPYEQCCFSGTLYVLALLLTSVVPSLCAEEQPPQPEVKTPLTSEITPASPVASADAKDQRPKSDEKEAAKKAEETIEVIVTATRVEEKVTHVPQTTSVVTHQELQERQPTTPSEALREEPGVFVQMNGRAGGSPIIRGQVGPRVLYLWDGIRVNNGALFGGPNHFLNQVQMGAIDRLEVVRGPASVQYGSDAIGGVINIITKQVNEFSEKPTYGGEVNGRYGSSSTEFTEFADFWLSTKHINMEIGGTLQDVGDYRGGKNRGEQENTSFEADGYYAKLGIQPAKNHVIRLGWQDNTRKDVEQYRQSKTNQPSGIPGLFGPRERRTLAKLDYQGDDLAPGLSQIKAYGYFEGYGACGEVNRETGTQISKVRTDADQQVLGFGMQAISPLADGKHRLIYGLDYREEELASSKTLFTTTKATRRRVVTTPAGNTPDGTYGVFDAFLMGEFHPLEHWTLSPGIRFERTELKSDPEPMDVLAPFTLEDLDLSQRWNTVTWSLGSLYWFNHHIGLAANVATGTRVPNFADTLSFSVPTHILGVANVPSPDLKPEGVTSYEIGPRVVFDHWELSATAYWSELSDFISSTDAGYTVNLPGIGNVRAMEKANIGQGYIAGCELSFRYAVTDSWSFWGTYTETYGQDTTNDLPMRFIPPRNAILGVRWQEAEKKRYWAEGLVRIVGRKGRPAPDDRTDAAFALDPALGSPNTTTNPLLRPDCELPGYAVFSVRGGAQVFTKGRVRTNVTLAIENILNKSYRDAYSRQMVEPGTNVVLGIQVKF